MAGKLAPAWKPGQSGNPGGRPKGLSRIVREKAPEGDLVDFYVAVWKGDTETCGFKPTPGHRMSAAEWLTERGHGKAPAFAPVEDADPLDRKQEDIERAADEFTAEVVRLSAVPHTGNGAGTTRRSNGRNGSRAESRPPGEMGGVAGTA